ncbi:MAG: hypothetical protein JJU33_03540 [Phycisphaerales bacterium]|nr:hypothetical protein [Phycisphaerales bacterium]
MTETSGQASQSVPGGVSGGPVRVGGVCHALFAFDVGIGIDLARAEALVRDGVRGSVVRIRRPSPAWFEYKPTPLRVSAEVAPIKVAQMACEPAVECTLYDFGAIGVNFRVPFDADIADLAELTRALYDNQELIDAARSCAESLAGSVKEAISKYELSAMVEDYAAISVLRWPEGVTPEGLLVSHRTLLARTLQAEGGGLSEQQIEHTLGARMGYGSGDLTVIDWNAALIFDPEPADVVSLLQHANVELLEMRLLDEQLDDMLDRSREMMEKVLKTRIWPLGKGTRAIREFAELATDKALLFEGVNNGIKLLGEQYMARLYRLISDRMNLPQWDAAVLHKLETVESVYDKLGTIESTKRLEVLEIIIILLIAISILMPFIPGLSGK